MASNRLSAVEFVEKPVPRDPGQDVALMGEKERARLAAIRRCLVDAEEGCIRFLLRAPCSERSFR